MAEHKKVEEDRFEDNEQYQYTKRTVLNPDHNGGEAVVFKLHVFENRDGTQWTRAELSTVCYGTHRTSVNFPINPEDLIEFLESYEQNEV